MIEPFQPLIQARESLLRELRASPEGLVWCRRHSDLFDQAIAPLFSTYLGETSTTLIATGGYGRREMSPYSDLDVSVLAESEQAAPDESLREFFKALHEVFVKGFGVRLGYSFRILSDALGIDDTTRTGLLDGRVLSGRQELWRELQAGLSQSLSQGEFILAKIRERELAMAKTNETPLVVEAHLKEGAGGLRSFHCANWIRAALGDPPLEPTPAFDRMLLARNLVHALAEKPEDRLTYAKQAEIADLLGVEMYGWMEALAKDRLDLHEAYLDAKSRVLKANYSLSPGVVAEAGLAKIHGADPGEAAVGIAIATELGLEVEPCLISFPEQLNGPAAMFAIGKSEAVLRNLDRAGILEAILPEVSTLRALMPRDATHAYSVFEHTMRAIRALDRLDPDSPLGQVLGELGDESLLRLAILLHDAGKVDPDRSHSQVGAELADEVAQRWGLAGHSARTLRWLVEEHLSMARTIRLRDLEDPATTESFAAEVGTEERLRLLTLLTYADISAVSPVAWTPTLEAFLLDLYRQTLHVLAAEGAPLPEASESRARLLRSLEKEEGADEAARAFVESLPANYLARTDDATILLHLEYARRARAGKATVAMQPAEELGATELTVCAADRPGLLSEILGAIYAYDFSLVGLRAYTTTGEMPIAIDRLVVTFGNRMIPPASASLAQADLRKILSGELTAEELLRARGKDPDLSQRLFSLKFIPGVPAILEFRAPRGRGMAYRLSRLLAREGWNVHAARVGIWGGQGAAAFYVESPKGPISESDVRAIFSERLARG